MLVKSPLKVEERCPRRWSLLGAVSLLSLAILGAGVGLRAGAAPAPKDDKKDETKKDKDVTKSKKNKDDKNTEKKDRLVQPDEFPNIEDLMKHMPANLSEEQAKQLRQHMEQMRKMMEQMRKQSPDVGGLPELPALPGNGIPEFPQFPQFQFPNGRWGTLNSRFGRHPEPRLGVRLDKPSDTLVDQLDLPKGQGLIVEDVMQDSAAAKAGLKKHDILLELDGKPVPNDVQEFARIVKDLKPDTKVDAVVLRKTRKETVKGLSLPKAKEAPQPGNFGGFGRGFGRPGRFGGAGLGDTMTIRRSNDAFTARDQQGDLTIEATGKIEDGKAKVDTIKVTEDGKTSTYNSVDKVPEKHRDRVKNLVEAASSNNLRFPFNRPRRQEN